MNERIQELALEAGLLNYVDNETPRHYFVHADIDEEDIEMFAELIVRECLDMADEFELAVNKSGLVDRIKEHFGVK